MHGQFARKPVQQRLPYKVREEKINQLNRRKAALLRQPQSRAVLQELEQIRIELHQL
jgi:hypothetical protein